MKNGTILIKLNRPCFQYEVHSLVRAFYPDREVKVDCEDTPWEEWESGVSFLLTICFKEVDAMHSSLSVCLQDGQGVRTEHGSVCGEGDRQACKNELKRLLYGTLCDYSKRTLPWGDLTGIRPVKIPMKLLREGKGEQEIADYMQTTYLVSGKKTALAIEIARREQSLLCGMQLSRPNAPYPALKNGYSLYVGIPFCPSICLYCSFSSSPIDLWRDRVDAYLDALCREIRAVSEMVRDPRPDTLYIGGGTPTTLSPGQMDRLLSELETCFDFSRLREFTVEAGRPDTINEETLAVLKKHAVTRISINPQTMNQKTLDLIGRKHTVGQIREAFALARKMGFDNINMDMIVGLPGEHPADVEHTMQELTGMKPESITVHSLAVKRAARLWLFREEHQELSFENSSELMDWTAGCAREAGLSPYYLYRQKNMAGNFENVGYASKGREGLYNVLIMEEVQTILALGAGAASKLVFPDGKIRRVENVKDIRNYMERTEEMIERKRKGLTSQEGER